MLIVHHDHDPYPTVFSQVINNNGWDEPAQSSPLPKCQKTSSGAWSKEESNTGQLYQMLIVIPTLGTPMGPFPSLVWSKRPEAPNTVDSHWSLMMIVLFGFVGWPRWQWWRVDYHVDGGDDLIILIFRWWSEATCEPEEKVESAIEVFREEASSVNSCNKSSTSFSSSTALSTLTSLSSTISSSTSFSSSSSPFQWKAHCQSPFSHLSPCQF